MQATDGATAKPWGWQIRSVFAPTEEVWLAHANAGGGMTSLHRHAKHTTQLHVLSGTIAVVLSDSKELQILKSGETLVIPQQKRHRLMFLSECRFAEVYTREKTAGVDVVDDTIRETT